MIRRNGLGASDASVYLGLMSKWNSPDKLVAQKLETTYTAEEQAISDKIIVQMGKVLEPLILSLWVKEFAHAGAVLEKPPQMFAIKEFPYLTVNFDGVATTEEVSYVFPVEAKYTTVFGDKYYDFNKAGSHPLPYGKPRLATVVEHCEDAGKHYGIPPYYYSQLQRQMYALQSPTGYLAVLRGKTNTFHWFEVHTDPWLQRQDIVMGYQIWERIMRQRNRLQS